MPQFIFYFFALIVGYLIGSIAPGLFYVKWATGKDVREVESGRTGGTNSYRAAGMKIGLLTGASDILKGAVAVWLAKTVLGGFASPEWVVAFAAVGVVAGHNWSVFLRFRGGAGTTPNLGWATFVWWPILPFTLLVLFGTFAVTGMASVVSLMLGALLPLVFGFRYFAGLDGTVAYFVASVITWFFITWSLRPNIKRILAGNERVVGPARKRAEKRRTKRLSMKASQGVAGD